VNTLKTFDIQARGPQKREAPGIFPVFPMVNPALGTDRSGSWETGLMADLQTD